MKLVTAVLAPERLDAVAAALAQVKVFRMTVTECRGVSRDAGSPTPELMAKLEIAVNEDFVRPTIEAIQTAGHLTDLEGGGGAPGDQDVEGQGSEELGFGKIFLTELLDVVRIRTGERGPDAI